MTGGSEGQRPKMKSKRYLDDAKAAIKNLWSHCDIDVLYHTFIFC